MNNQDNDEPFLSRWSRRKRGSAVTPDAVPEPLGQSPATAPDGETTTAATDQAPVAGKNIEEEPLDLSKLPRVEDLTADSNIAAFLDKRVPAVLRNAALGRIWTLDPTIRDFIEVAENQWNWNVPGGAPFYELMEPGTGAGTLMADATSAIARTMGDAVSQKPAAIAAGETDIQLAVDELSSPVASPDDAAVQENCSMEQIQEPALKTESIHVDNTLDEQNGMHVAAQHTQTPESMSARRRHGTALPT